LRNMSLGATRLEYSAAPDCRRGLCSRHSPSCLHRRIGPIYYASPKTSESLRFGVLLRKPRLLSLDRTGFVKSKWPNRQQRWDSILVESFIPIIDRLLRSIDKLVGEQREKEIASAPRARTRAPQAGGLAAGAPLGREPKIAPIVLEGPPPPTPPESLKSIHFDDSLRYVTAAVEAKLCQ
jgi:hypothetical protein